MPRKRPSERPDGKPGREDKSGAAGAPASEKSLEALRAEVDAVDDGILDLLDRRARTAKAIGKLKASDRASFYDPRREREIYERIEAANEGPLPGPSLRAIWREIMSASLALEQPAPIAYFGPPGTFTHQAARAKFGTSVGYLPERTIPEVFAAVENGRAQFGVVPIENSTEGPVNVTIDMLAETSLRVVGEAYLPIHLALLGRGPISAVRRVYSHAQALGQARRYLAANLPEAEVREAASTIAAVETAAVERGAAAIASELAAEGRDVEVLARRIQDSADNETRFFVVGREPVGRSGRDKTTMMVSIKDEVGALHSMLSAFRDRGVNLTSIHSRPSRRRAWDYVFFLDCEGHLEDENVKGVIATLESRMRHVQILGAYPAAAAAAD